MKLKNYLRPLVKLSGLLAMSGIGLSSVYLVSCGNHSFSFNDLTTLYFTIFSAVMAAIYSKEILEIK